MNLRRLARSRQAHTTRQRSVGLLILPRRTALLRNEDGFDRERCLAGSAASVGPDVGRRPEATLAEVATVVVERIHGFLESGAPALVDLLADAVKGASEGASILAGEGVVAHEAVVSFEAFLVGVEIAIAVIIVLVVVIIIVVIVVAIFVSKVPSMPSISNASSVEPSVSSVPSTSTAPSADPSGSSVPSSSLSPSSADGNVTAAAPSVSNSISSAPSHFPSTSRVPSTSLLPTTIVITPDPQPDLEMKLYGLDDALVDAEEILFESRTAEYIEEFYNNYSLNDGGTRGDVLDVVAVLSITEEVLGNGAAGFAVVALAESKAGNVRALQLDDSNNNNDDSTSDYSEAD